MRRNVDVRHLDQELSFRGLDISGISSLDILIILLCVSIFSTIFSLNETLKLALPRFRERFSRHATNRQVSLNFSIENQQYYDIMSRSRNMRLQDRLLAYYAYYGLNRIRLAAFG